MASELVDFTATVTTLIILVLLLSVSIVTLIALCLRCRLMRHEEVRPGLKHGQSGPGSNESKPIQTAIINPSKPGQPSALNVTHDSIELEWSKPEQGAHNVTCYSILYRSTSDLSDQWMLHETKAVEGKMTVTISQLSENTTYLFKVRPESLSGEPSPESDESEPIQTAIIIPSKPGQPSARNVTHDSIEFEWSKPEQGAHNVRCYSILYRSTSDPSDQWILHETKAIEGKTTVTVSLLSENTTYLFKVQAELLSGEPGLESDKSEPVLTKMVVPSKPGPPRAVKVSNNSIDLEWSKPEKGVHNVISYSILYHSCSDLSDQWKLHETKAIEGKATITILPLSENSTYKFKVRPESLGGEPGPESDESEPVLIKLNVIFPSKPGQPRAIQVSDNSIDLEWSKPEQGTQNILSYSVFYHSIGEPNSSDKWSEICTPYEKVSLSNLSEGTTYTCYIKVCPKHTYANKVDEKSYVSEPIQTLRSLNEKNAINLAWDARIKWYHIGIQLGQRTADLDVISKEIKDDMCFTRMITEWVRRGKATWNELIDALNHKTVGFSNLADTIAASCVSKHCSITEVVPFLPKKGFKCPFCDECSMEEYYKGKCPKLDSSCDSSFPHLEQQHLTENQRIKLYIRLTEEAEDIRDEFNDLLEKVRGSLNRQGVNCQQMLESTEDFLGSHQIDSSKIDSPSKVIRYLQQKKYISFFNCHIVQKLIAKFGTDKDKEILKAYDAKFKKFCERSVFEVPQAVFGPSCESDSGPVLAFKVTNEVTRSLCEVTPDKSVPPSFHAVKMSSETLNLSLSDTLKIQGKIAKLLHIENIENLIFLGAQEGCIELRFLVPTVILDRIKQQNVTDLPDFTSFESEGIHILCGPPGKPYVSDVTADSIRLQWKKPKYQGPKQIQHYCVHYISLNDPSAGWKTVVSEGFVESLKIVGLSYNQSPFIFKVQAVNAIGAGLQSEKSDPIQLSIKRSNLNIGKPSKPQALNITHDSIQLEWTKPEEHSNSITSYAILYHSIYDPPYQWMIQRHTNSTEERVVVSQLLENTIYYFQVEPEFETGIGLESDISDPIMTKRIIPSKPGKPKALKVTHQSIELEWSKPEQGAHNVTYYSVLYRSTSNLTDYWTVYEATTTEERVTVLQLCESTTYYLKIQPQCADGDGLVSDVSDPISTEMITPSQPGKPQCIDVNRNSIEIEWSEPEQGAHNITSYTILYRSAASDPSDAWMQQRVKSTQKSSTVLGLSEDTIYLFKIRPDCGDTFGSESDTSEPIVTRRMVPRQSTTLTVTEASASLGAGCHDDSQMREMREALEGLQIEVKALREAIDSKNEELSKKMEELNEMREERNHLMKRLQWKDEDQRKICQRMETELNCKIDLLEQEKDKLHKTIRDLKDQMGMQKEVQLTRNQKASVEDFEEVERLSKKDCAHTKLSLGLLLCIGVVVLFLFGITDEVQSRLLCLVNPGKEHILKMELESLKLRYHQAKKEIEELKEVKRENELLKQKETDATQADKELSHETGLEKKNCEKSKHQLEAEVMDLKTKKLEYDMLKQKETDATQAYKELSHETGLEKNCEKSKRQLEAEVMDLKTKKLECGTLKQKTENIAREKEELLGENLNLERELIKFGECNKQLQATNSDKKVCESLKENLTKTIHHLNLELVSLRKDNKSMHSQVCSEREKNGKLTAEKRGLQLDYEALESQYSQVKVDKARLEERVNYNIMLLVTLCVIFACSCCMPCSTGDGRKPVFLHVVAAIEN